MPLFCARGLRGVERCAWRSLCFGWQKYYGGGTVYTHIKLLSCELSDNAINRDILSERLSIVVLV